MKNKTSRLKKALTAVENRVKNRLETFLVLVSAITVLTGRATGQNATDGAVECTPPDGLGPLFDLLNTIAELAFLAGIGLGTVGFLVAAIFYMLPGENYSRQGKRVAKNVLIGTILLLSSNMIVSFLVSQLGGTVC